MVQFGFSDGVVAAAAVPAASPPAGNNSEKRFLGRRFGGQEQQFSASRRAHFRARLDAVYFLLYGITDRDDVRYILDTFPIVREHDERACGRYRTRDLILAYMNALEAGDADTIVAL